MIRMDEMVNNHFNNFDDDWMTSLGYIAWLGMATCKALGIQIQHFYQDECPLDPGCSGCARQNASLGHNMMIPKR